MGVRIELRLALAVLLVLELGTALAAVVLLGRMSPAIELILADNVASVEAAEDMLREIARAGALDERQARFEDALERARRNVTLEEEQPLVELVRRRGPAALAAAPGEPAREEVIDAIHRLAALNRISMGEADERAKQLGFAGAWAATFLGLTSLLLALLLVRRLDRRIADPLDDLHEVVAAVARGDRHRRCHSAGPPEIIAIGRGLNRLLDDRGAPERTRRLAEVDRATVLRLLDALPEPAFVVRIDGTVVSASESALDLLEGSEREALQEAVGALLRGEVTDHPAVASLEELLPGEAWLVRLPRS